MFPRGEVGAGVLAVSIGYGVSGMAVTVAILSLALNLTCTGLFVWAVNRLLAADRPGFWADADESEHTAAVRAH